MTELSVGLDLGSTNVKAVVVDPEARVLGVARRPTPTRADAGGTVHPFADLLQAAEAVVRDAAAQAGRDDIAAVGIASVAEAGVPVGPDGAPLDDVLAWFDPRPAAQARRLAEAAGDRELFARTGLRPEPKVTLAKLAWLRDERPRVFARMTEWRFVADAVAGAWTGGRGTSATLACRSMAWNLRRGAWDDELLSLVGLRAEQMPPVLPWRAPLGRLTTEVGARLGLRAGIPLAVAGHDHVVGALAAGVVAPADLLDSIGTAEALLLVTAEPALDDVTRSAGFSVGTHVLDDRATLIAGIQTSGAFVDWFLTALAGVPADAADGVRYERLASLVAAASRRPSGVIAVPTLRGRTAPLPDPSATGSFAGLTAADGLPELALAALEGTAFHARWLVDELTRLSGIRPRRVRTIGGGSRNDTLLRIKAALSAAPLEVVDEPETVAVGAALVAAVAAGIAPEGVVLERSPAIRAIEARGADRAAYGEAYAAFRRAVRA
ncbi:MAG TPA: FGGY family carbohydrate kinase [Candidatus Limnocylindrales bacterium]